MGTIKQPAVVPDRTLTLRADKVRKLVAGSEHGGRADVGSSGAWRTEWPWLSTSSPQAWKALGRREYYLARTKLD